MSLFRKKITILDLTDEAYNRWLRARSPQPIGFFLDLEEVEQESLALLGDEYTQDFCLGIGFAVHDPVAAQAGLDAAENPASEGDLLMRLAHAAARKAQGGTNGAEPAPRQKTPPTMGGLSERHIERVAATQREADEARSFLGRKPDPVQA